ncbi:MAG: hypothetical protein K8F52_03160 [Candidatus Scalindua rubra]|nr:hypothetical protein [Candidatus Scalindua rubra]
MLSDERKRLLVQMKDAYYWIIGCRHSSLSRGIQYWNPLEREEHIFVFTCLNHVEPARKPKSRAFLQAQALKRIKWLENN